MAKKAARKQALMDEIFEGPHSLMGRIFDGPDSIMGRIFGTEAVFESAPVPTVPAIRVRVKYGHLVDLVRGKPLVYRANGQVVRLELDWER